MKSLIYIALIFCLSLVINAQNKIPKNHSTKGLTCKTCHNCDLPTKKDPCLIPCPRADMITVHQTAEDAPAIITMDKLEDKYSPVVFQHKVHAQMSQMSGGCKSCHHFNNIGPIQKCESCHEANRMREDLSKPDLKGAYHRQCMDCHREWSHNTDCNSCHQLKSKFVKKGQKSPLPVIRVKNHPDVEKPTKIIFETNYNKGKLVTFYHDDHVDKFNLDCTSCHKQESCNRCHDRNKVSVAEMNSIGETVKIHLPKAEQHKACFSCHKNDSCTKCHSDKKMERFDHAIAAGWKLNKFHEKLNCQKCHGNTTTFTKPNNECSSCHKDFVAGKFDHKITGIELTGSHKEADCTDCHQTKDFSNPVCTNCHDDKSFPKDAPGKLIKISHK